MQAHLFSLFSFFLWSCLILTPPTRVVPPAAHEEMIAALTQYFTESLLSNKFANSRQTSLLSRAMHQHGTAGTSRSDKTCQAHATQL
jgi:hypothetical protein